MAIKRTISVLLLVALALIAQPIPPPAQPIIQQVIKTLSSAQIQALFTTPVTAIPAPGPGNAIQVTDEMCEITYGGVAYTGNGSFQLFYNNSSGTAAFGTMTSGFLKSTANFSVIAIPVTALGNSATNIVNLPIVFVDSQAPGAGNGTVKCWIAYRILKGL